MLKQLIVSKTILDKRKMLPVKNSWQIFKPSGGLWSSTYLGLELGSAWVQWCLAQEFKQGEKNNFPCYIVTPKKDTNIYKIDSYNDLEVLHTNGYTIEHRGFDDHLLIGLDFEKLAKDYDGIHLTDRGQRETNISESESYKLWGWDCECTLFFRWVFDEVISINTRSFIRMLD